MHQWCLQAVHNFVIVVCLAAASSQIIIPQAFRLGRHHKMHTKFCVYVLLLAHLWFSQLIIWCPNKIVVVCVVCVCPIHSISRRVNQMTHHIYYTPQRHLLTRPNNTHCKLIGITDFTHLQQSFENTLLLFVLKIT